MSSEELTGETEGSAAALLEVLSALANPHRLRILAALADGREYVSQLAREMGLSRPLLHMHLQKLEHAGLVSGQLELGSDGKAMKYYQLVPFSIVITPERVAQEAAALGIPVNTGELREEEV